MNHHFNLKWEFLNEFEEKLMKYNKKLKRIEEGKMIAGVCTGLADYFNIDPTIIRLALVLFTFFGGCGILAYIIAVIVMPKD